MEEKNILVENSTSAYSSQGLVTMLYEDNTTGDLASYKMLLGKLIKRSEKVSIYDEMVNTFKVAVPEGKVPVIGLKYDAVNDTDWKTTKVIYVSGTIGAVGDSITSSGGAEGTILYIEDDTSDSVTTLKVLVDVTSGTFAVGETISGETISAIYTNTVGTGNLLSGYDGDYAVNDGETNKDTINEYKTLISVSEYLCKTRQSKTQLTMEFIQDIKSVFKQAGVKTIINILYNAMDKHLEQRIIKYIRSIATQRADIVIDNSANSMISLKDQYYEIYSRINASKNRIGTNTNIAKGYFVTASSAVCAGLETILPIKEYKKKDNTNAVGYLPNGMLLIEDGYSIDNYFVVGTKGVEDNVNGGLVYLPYSYDLVTVTDPSDFKETLVPFHRYDLVRNKLDTKIDTTGSDFYEMTVVTYNDVENV